VAATGKRARSRGTRKPQLVVSREAALHKAPAHAANFFSSNVKRNLALGLLLGLTFAVYFRATRNPFIQHDDQDYVLENQHVKHGLKMATLRWALTSTEESNWHPLTWLSHALDCQLFGLNPAGHHFTNVLLHVLNVGLLFWLLWRATGAVERSLLVAALFALHPLNVESVAWVAERKNVLCMFCFLLTVAAYGWYARRPGWKRYLWVAGLFVLALAAKPMAVTLPCALLLLDFWPLQRVRGRGAPSETFPVPQQPLGRLVLEKLPLLALSAASSVITTIAQRGAIKQHLSFSVRLVNALYAYLMYLVKAFWPVHLAALYPYEGARLFAWQALLCFALLGSITAMVWHERKRLYLPVGWFWYLGTLVPMIGLVQVGEQGMADRYAYLPLVGIFVMVVWAFADWVPAGQLRQRWYLVAAGVILALFSVLTWRQIGTWRSGYDLWSHTLQVTKNNYLAEDYMAFELVAQSGQTGDSERCTDEIFTHFQNAVRINPVDDLGHLNLGACLQERGQLQKAIEEDRRVLELTKDKTLVARSLGDLATAYSKQKNYSEAEQYYRRALAMDPENSTVRMELGIVEIEGRIEDRVASATAHPSAPAYFRLGQVQQVAGQVAQASASYEKALRLDPRFSKAKKALNGGEIMDAIKEYKALLGENQDPSLRIKSSIDLGAAYHGLGDYEMARRYYLDCLKLDPENVPARKNLEKLTLDETIQKLSTSASANPSPDAYLQLGRIQQFAGKIAEARKSYEAALKLDPQFSEAREALSDLEADGSSMR